MLVVVDRLVGTHRRVLCHQELKVRSHQLFQSTKAGVMALGCPGEHRQRVLRPRRRVAAAVARRVRRAGYRAVVVGRRRGLERCRIAVHLRTARTGSVLAAAKTVETQGKDSVLPPGGRRPTFRSPTAARRRRGRRRRRGCPGACRAARRLRARSAVPPGA